MSITRASRLRTVVLEKAAERAHDDAVAKYPKFETAYEALEWLIARTPERGHRFAANDNEIFIYAQGPDPIRHTPVICVLFTYSDSSVHISHMAVWPPDYYDQ